MGDIAKGVLGGGWALLVGWILPAALNLAVFTLAVAPSLHRPTVLDPLWPATGGPTALVLLVATVLLGLVLNALQTPLYRALEGYTLWPAAAYERGCRVQRSRRQRAVDRLADPAFTSPIRRALLQEKLSRYPVSGEQVAPTRLGNAIRRLEEYGYDRYRLDTQVLWNELTSAAPEPTTKQVVTARTSVDFFLALLYGHAAVAVTAFASLSASHAHRSVLVLAGVSLIVLIPVWYNAAVAATDEWAAAVRALVNLGRKPLAEGLGLALPKSLEDERLMWKLVTRMSAKAYAPAADAAFAPYRVDPSQAAGEQTQPVS
ncbi:hypothetical protein [Streptomyces scabiei]|uniref:hypothetical protein n=1 Tax=Streptomyces scabiei TaxID=1930 RepID=UPI0029A227DC|nr:hypothetical protein [Streptomyces scabiei]MDX3523313.1 hypothetical protein [Streptomyces scabiei]